MVKYLIKHSIEVFKKDGLLELIREILKFLGLYSTPDKVLKWIFVKLAGVEYAVKEVQSSRMILNLKDNGIHRDLYLHGIREPQATRYLQSIMRPEWVVMECGANIGYYALQEARIVKEVIAIEPTPDSFKVLSDNIKLNDYKNIRAYRMAMGDHNGEAKFEISKACNWNKIASKDNKDKADNLTVNMFTIDSFLNGQKIDYLRMDVEGYELRILKGMTETLKNSKPRMFIEVHRDMLREYGGSQLELMQFMADLGYSIEKSYIMGRESSTGIISNLLKHEDTRLEITERGIASHIFFKVEGK